MAKVKTGRGLFETSQEELQNLQNQSGTEITSPAGAAAAGSKDKDQAAAAGAPAHLKKVQEDRGSSLSMLQRTEQARTEATTDEAALAQRAEILQQFGSLVPRVDEIIQKHAAATGDEAAANAQAMEALIRGKVVGDDGERDANLGDYMSLVPEIQAEYDAMAPQLEAVGLAGWQDMTPAELQDAIEAEKSKEFSKVEQMKQDMVDPAVSSREKQAVARDLKEMSGVGMFASEAAVARQVERSAEFEQNTGMALETFADTMGGGDEVLAEELKTALTDGSEELVTAIVGHNREDIQEASAVSAAKEDPTFSSIMDQLPDAFSVGVEGNGFVFDFSYNGKELGSEELEIVSSGIEQATKIAEEAGAGATPASLIADESIGSDIADSFMPGGEFYGDPAKYSDFVEAGGASVENVNNFNDAQEINEDLKEAGALIESGNIDDAWESVLGVMGFAGANIKTVQENVNKFNDFLPFIDKDYILDHPEENKPLYNLIKGIAVLDKDGNGYLEESDLVDIINDFKVNGYGSDVGFVDSILSGKDIPSGENRPDAGVAVGLNESFDFGATFPEGSPVKMWMDIGEKEGGWNDENIMSTLTESGIMDDAGNILKPEVFEKFEEYNKKFSRGINFDGIKEKLITAKADALFKGPARSVVSGILGNRGHVILDNPEKFDDYAQFINKDGLQSAMDTIEGELMRTDISPAEKKAYEKMVGSLSRAQNIVNDRAVDLKNKYQRWDGIVDYFKLGMSSQAAWRAKNPDKWKEMQERGVTTIKDARKFFWYAKKEHSRLTGKSSEYAGYRGVDPWA